MPTLNLEDRPTLEKQFQGVLTIRLESLEGIMWPHILPIPKPYLLIRTSASTLILSLPPKNSPLRSATPDRGAKQPKGTAKTNPALEEAKLVHLDVDSVYETLTISILNGEFDPNTPESQVVGTRSVQVIKLLTQAWKRKRLKFEIPLPSPLCDLVRRKVRRIGHDTSAVKEQAHYHNYRSSFA